ncbi:MAG: hypothetical protein NTW32_14360 [Chloroflexi bacterium]|nr:hypothetical protein [Chloroflexota bacterium]
MKHAVVLMVVFMMMFVMVAPASAGPARVAANGTWNDCNFGAVARTAGPNVVVTINITQNFFGTLDGKFVGTEVDVVKADGSAEFRGSGIFTGGVAGTGASGTYRYEGIARANKFHATWVLTGVTDELLAPVAGNGNWTGQFDGVSDQCADGLFSGTYEGSVKVGR